MISTNDGVENFEDLEGEYDSTGYKRIPINKDKKIEVPNKNKKDYFIRFLDNSRNYIIKGEDCGTGVLFENLLHKELAGNSVSPKSPNFKGGVKIVTKHGEVIYLELGCWVRYTKDNTPMFSLRLTEFKDKFFEQVDSNVDVVKKYEFLSAKVDAHNEKLDALKQTDEQTTTFELFDDGMDLFEEIDMR